MSLSERLKELKGARILIRRPQLPLSLKIQRSYKQVSQKFDQITPVRKVDYDALLTKLRLVAKSRAMATLSQREMRLSASCLFDGEIRLADDHNFLAQFLDAQRSIRSRVAIRRLIHAYCSHFETGHPGIRQIGIFLREAVSTIPSSKRWVWPESLQRLLRTVEMAEASIERSSKFLDVEALVHPLAVATLKA